LEGTPLAAFHRASTMSRGRHAEPWVADIHNLVVLSRWPIAAVRELRGELVEPPAWRPAAADAASPLPWDRPLLHVRIDLPGGRPLHVIDLHLRAPIAADRPGAKEAPFVWRSAAAWAEGFYIAALKRAGQALEARLLVDALQDADPEAL